MPTIVRFTHQAVPLLEDSDRSKVKLGAYPIHRSYEYTPFSDTDASFDLDLTSMGFEVSLAIAAAGRFIPLCPHRLYALPVPLQPPALGLQQNAN
jgi:dihydroxyacetone synthase